MLILFQILTAVVELLRKVQNTTFFECPLYTEARDRLFQSLNLGIDININFQLLTSGSQDFDNETNRSIPVSVLRFLKDSHRFDQYQLNLNMPFFVRII